MYETSSLVGWIAGSTHTSIKKKLGQIQYEHIIGNDVKHTGVLQVSWKMEKKVHVEGMNTLSPTYMCLVVLLSWSDLLERIEDV